MQASALTARNLYCRRGERLLFGGIDLALGRGDALHLVGPNGIGKTSLIRILAGLRQPSEATELRATGRKGGRGSAEWLGSVALLDERPALDEHQTLRKALGFWRGIDGGAADPGRLGLAGLLDVPVRFLSTGQRKRAALARLLGQNADHWLLDEPLNGLDSEGAALLESLIAERRAAGGAVVVASHQPIDLPQARTLDLRDHPA